ncbi:MAG: ABC transporter permease [Bacteroidales bacterium]|jgi:putative ABC transport system permease protein|nr:ABC transporter permease [Bacteroidales bacterium]
MFFFDLKIIIRNSLRNKAFSAINILGLSLGLTTAMLILMWVWDELSYDRFHDNADNIYMLINKNSDDQGNSEEYVESPAPMADYLVKNIPGVKDAVRIDYYYVGGLIQKDNDFFKEKGAGVDDSFFKIFNIPFILGDKNEAFSNLESIVISESIAKRYYGTINPLGKILKLKGYGDTYKTVTVTGVFKDFPSNSSIKLDFMVPFFLEKKNYLDNWNVSSYATLVLLDRSVDLNLVNKKITSIYNDVIDDSHFTSYLFPLVDMHVKSTLSFFRNEEHGNSELINLLLFIAILILLIACINYINLATARSVKKLNEFSIKRILGVSHKKLFQGFLIESFLFTLISFYIAIILIELTRPVFNNLTGKNLSINYSEPKILIIVILIIGLMSIISAFYPYLFIASKRKGLTLNFVQEKNSKRIQTRKILVIIQFVVSIILIIFSSVILKQINFIYSKDLGFDKENIITLHCPELGDKVDVFKNELLKNANVISVTNGSLPWGGGWPDLWSWEGRSANSKLAVHRIHTDSDFLKITGIKLLKGRYFSEEFSDSSSIVINEKFAKLIGTENIIGKEIRFRNEPYKVIGVTDNFYSTHFSEDLKPAVFYETPSSNVLIKVKDDKLKETLESVIIEYKKIVTDRHFKYTTLEQAFDALYFKELRMGKLFCYFSFLAIFISCLGLFGISVFATEQRIKEIGIRKTLGASSANIIYILNTEFVKLLVVAYIIACPIAYYFTVSWLQDFVFRTELSWWIFVLAGIAVLLISIITVSWQSYNSARRNPVESLRYE